MGFAAINAEILDIEAAISHQCAVLERLPMAEPAAVDARARVIASLDCLLLALRVTQGHRNQSLIAHGFPPALGWASRVVGCPVRPAARADRVESIAIVPPTGMLDHHPA